jgi:hypothetical protein
MGFPPLCLRPCALRRFLNFLSAARIVAGRNWPDFIEKQRFFKKNRGLTRPFRTAAENMTKLTLCIVK